MEAKKLSEKGLATALKGLHGWIVVDGKLRRVFELKDFSEAFAFMTRVALAAESMNHHPDWSNAWNKVTIELVTHSADGITPNDIDLARQISQISGS
ncbi:MAG: 4a-hydroxytetrahydrobiopterin dehydratase [Candidatus Acidiferrales bacterium]